MICPKEFMSDLYNVGTKKAVGYLPYDNISEYGNDKVENVIKWCEKKKLKYIHFKPWQGSTGSGGAFYVYDYDKLARKLKKHKDALLEAKIPLDPDKYIQYIENHLVDQSEYMEAYRVIGLTFNDKRFR